MKIVDTRDQTTMEGEYIATFVANQPVSDADMLRFYGLRPSGRHFELLSAAQPLDRLVLRRGGDDEDASYYIVPKYPFYKETP